MSKLKNEHYEYLAIGFAVLAVIWMFLGQGTWDYYFKFKPPVPGGGLLNPFHEGPVILLSLVGTVLGFVSRDLNKKFSVGLISNLALLLPLLFAVGVNYY